MANLQTLPGDLLAAASVVCMSIPLTLAIGVNSGVPPEVALWAAAVSAPIAAAFGGTTLAVTGPAAIITVLVSQAVGQHGLAALPLITLGVGALQLLSGIANIGWLVKLIPVPVIAGFTSGVGVMISVGQLPRLLGLQPAGPDAGTLAALRHVAQRLGEADAASLALGALALALVAGVPRLHRKAGGAAIPVAVGAATAASAALAAMGMADVAVIGALEVPWGLLLRLPAAGDLLPLAPTTLLIYLFASVESLLGAQAIDRVRPTPYQHDASQELIGQGIANMTLGVCSGMPVTCVIARSSLSVQSGARSRLSAALQGVLLLGAVSLCGPLLAVVPLPALAAVSFYSGCRMLRTPEIMHALQVQRTDAIPFAATVLGMLSLGWAEGLLVGLSTSFLFCGANWNRPETARLAFEPAHSVRVALGLYSADRLWGMDKGQLIRLVLGNYQKEVQHTMDSGGLSPSSDSTAETCPECGGEGEVLHVMSSHATPDDLSGQTCPTCDGTGLRSPPNRLPKVWWLNGPLNFMSVFRVAELVDVVRADCRGQRRAIFDLHGCEFVDLTGAEALLDGLHTLREEGIRVTLMNAPHEFQNALTAYARFAQFDVYRQFIPGVRPHNRSSMHEAELLFPE